MTSELQQETPDQDQAVPVDATPPKRLGMSTSVQLLGIALAFVALGAVIGTTIKTLQGRLPDASSQPFPGASNSPYGFTSGDLAPNFTVETLDGKIVSLSDYRGKTVLLNFWATWCPPCRSEMPDLEQLYRERKGQGFVVLAVDLQEPKGPVADFVDRFGLTFPILMDASGEVAERYNIQVLPSTFFIDKEGRIATFNFGAMNRSAVLKKLEMVKE